MIEKERIKQLEEKIAELEQRLEMLEARPYVWPQWPTYDENISWPRCTCGTTVVCPIHGGRTISDAYEVPNSQSM